MAIRVNAHDADETNVNRLWDLEANRTSHLKKLETIYKQRQAVRVKSEKVHLKRLKQLEKYHISKVKDFDTRNRSVQDKINYQNSLLRNKILQIYQKTNPYRKSRSFFNNDTDRVSPFKMNQAQEMYKTNLKIGERLTHIRSQIGAICKIQQHTKKSQKLLDMIQRKSPKKKAYLKSLTKKKFYADILLPEFEDNYQ